MSFGAFLFRRRVLLGPRKPGLLRRLKTIALRVRKGMVRWRRRS